MRESPNLTCINSQILMIDTVLQKQQQDEETKTQIDALIAAKDDGPQQLHQAEQMLKRNTSALVGLIINEMVHATILA